MVMRASCPDRELLERLQSAARAEAAPDPADCDALAGRLMSLGESAAAARWHSWGILPPPAETLLEAIRRDAAPLLHGPGQCLEECQPQWPVAWQGLAERLQQGAPAAELESLARQLRQQPGLEPRQRLLLSQQLLEARAPRAALAVLDPLMAEAGRDCRLANRLAQVQRACGDVHQAELWSRLSLRLRPDQPQVWFLLARLLLDQGEIDAGLHSAETGLQYAPGHPWGQKLRANALAANRGWHSYEQLLKAGELPDDPQFLACLELERQRYQRRASLARRWPEPPELDLRLRLRSLLRGVQQPVVLLQGRNAETLSWLMQAGVWTEPPPVAPHASRDPLRVTEELAAAGFVVQPERSLQQLLEMPRIELLVIARPVGRRLPRQLAGPIGRAMRLLAPVGLLRLPQQQVARWGGWELFTAAAGLDG